MSKTTFLGYVPSLKAKHEATIVEGKAIESKGGSIRYTLRGEYEGRKTLPKTVSKADFEGIYGFDAKEAEAVLMTGELEGLGKVNMLHMVGIEDENDFTPEKIVPIRTMNDYGKNKVIKEMKKLEADTVGSPSPASVEPPAPSETPFPQEPSNENFSAPLFSRKYTPEKLVKISMQGEDEEVLRKLFIKTAKKKGFEDFIVERFSYPPGGETLEEIVGTNEYNGLDWGTMVYWMMEMQKKGSSLSAWKVLMYDSKEDMEQYINGAETKEKSMECPHCNEEIWNIDVKATCELCGGTLEEWIDYPSLVVGETEVKESFLGFGDDEDEDEEKEEEKPKEQEFTVVLQEGDKLELTDIEEETEEDVPEEMEPKEEDNGEDEENDEKEEEDDASEDESEDEENDEKEAESIEVWEMIQQNLNNPDAVREFYRVLVGDPDDFKGDDMSLVVAEVYQQNDNSQEFVDWVHKELFSAEETLDTLIVLRQKAAKEEGLENWKNDSNAGMLSGEIQERIWKHKDFGAECDCEHRTQKDESCWECKSCGEHYTQEFGAELVKDMLMICPSCDETVPEYSSCMACGQQFRSEDFDFVGWIPEADNPDNCFICGKSNQGFEGNDNVCTTCHESWEYDEGGEEGEGYYLKETKRAVSAKVTRPVKEEEKEEEEKEEEGMSTLMKVGLGVGALAVSAAILGAEERVAVMWEGKDDNNNGLIYGIEYYGEDGEFSDVEWFRTADQRDAMLLDSDGESDYWEGENAHWRAEGSGEDFQKMTSSEFVPFDQITAEIQEEWDETTVPVAADYEPLNEPTNANFSAEEMAQCQGCGEMEYANIMFHSRRGHNCFTCFQEKIYPNLTEREQMHYLPYMERFDANTVGSPSPSGPSSVPEPAEATGSEPSNSNFSAESGRETATKEVMAHYGDEGWEDDEYEEVIERRLDGYCIECSEPFHDSCGMVSRDEGCSCCDNTRDSLNEHGMDAESNNMSWVIGLTALGVGVAALGYSDKILALFDRFKK